MAAFMTVIEAENLHKDYPGCAGALSGASISACAGEAIAIVGANGSGKSTLFKCLLGLVPPDSGSVRIFGQVPAGRGRSVLSRVGALLEGRANLYERLSIAENCDYYCALRGFAVNRLYMLTLADRLGLVDLRVPVRRLSTGNRQRAALLCAMVHQPALLMLDEPTLGLDREGVLALQALLREQQQRGVTVLTISHDAAFVAAAADRVIGMVAGRWGFERGGCRLQGPSQRFRLLVGATQPLPADVSAQLVDSGSFSEQLLRLQELARLYPDICQASIHPVLGLDLEAALKEAKVNGPPRMGPAE